MDRVKNLRMWVLAAGVCACAVGCSIKPLAPAKRFEARKELPEELAAPFRYEDVAVEPELTEVEATDTYRHLKGVYQAPDPAASPATPRQIDVTFQLFLSRKGQGPRPVVVVMPILGGSYGISKTITRHLCEAGFHAFFVHREKDLLDEHNEPEDIDGITRRSLVNSRRTLDWVSALPEVDGERVGLAGVSLGAIGGSIFAAVEPRVDRAMIIMGGGDLADILTTSFEQGVHEYKVARMDRLELETDDEVRESLQSIAIEPLRYAPYVDTANVLQILTTHDNRVPTPNQWRLWRAFGEPRGFAIPCGHYSLMLYLGFVQDRMVEFFSELERAPETAYQR